MPFEIYIAHYQRQPHRAGTVLSHRPEPRLSGMTPRYESSPGLSYRMPTRTQAHRTSRDRITSLITQEVISSRISPGKHITTVRLALSLRRSNNSNMQTNSMDRTNTSIPRRTSRLPRLWQMGGHRSMDITRLNRKLSELWQTRSLLLPNLMVPCHPPYQPT